MRVKSIVAIGAAALLSGCAGGVGADPSPVWASDAAPAELAAPVADLVVWPADIELRAWVLTVAPRIEAATGLKVVASETYSAIPLFWAAAGAEAGWLGLTHVAARAQPEWLAIEPSTPMAVRETVVLHEVLHALGADHVDTGAGVLSPQIWDAFPITEADLGALCSVQDCPVFAPEGVMP